MPINTFLDGDPGSVYATTQWLRGRLAPEVSAGAIALRSVGGEAAERWHGVAGQAFRGRMSDAEVKVDNFKTEISRTADVLNRYADGLSSALASMAHARAIAVQAGLIVSGPVIVEPIPAGVTDATYHRRVIAFRQADIEVRRGRLVMSQSNELVRGRLAESRGHPVIQPTDVSRGAGLSTPAGELVPNGNPSGGLEPNGGDSAIAVPNGASPGTVPNGVSGGTVPNGASLGAAVGAGAARSGAGLSGNTSTGAGVADGASRISGGVSGETDSIAPNGGADSLEDNGGRPAEPGTPNGAGDASKSPEPNPSDGGRESGASSNGDASDRPGDVSKSPEQGRADSAGEVSKSPEQGRAVGAHPATPSGALTANGGGATAFNPGVSVSAPSSGGSPLAHELTHVVQQR
ncbi:hypothetical protein [Actinoplanes sp. L3-i22]|uniref:hypothetical protein n=1 Tax=Actinoplanes sp. L3-i22 TaxID=2836373 RepID=UPI001C7745F2|nr:hypothetical protein [Actinoplanes sp. L3-i22]BCY11193.1 hypothetical protein L3i22_062810 [Actinoplanes sp. L3-i22]